MKKLTNLKDKLDKVFSLYIRLRDSDENGTVECFTSGKLMHYKQAHAGHYISRRHLSTRWDEVNVQVQSVKENIFNQGNAPVFAIKLDEKYGEGTSKNLVKKSNEIFKPTKDWYIEKIDYYKNKVDKLFKNIS